MLPLVVKYVPLDNQLCGGGDITIATDDKHCIKWAKKNSGHLKVGQKSSTLFLSVSIALHNVKIRPTSYAGIEFCNNMLYHFQLELLEKEYTETKTPNSDEQARLGEVLGMAQDVVRVSNIKHYIF